jgi:exopolysaccharide biosynthesis protein
MKKITAGILAISMMFSVLLTAASAEGAGTVVYRNTQQLTNNLSYTNTISWSSENQRQESYTLGLSGKGDAYPIFMACDTIYGRMTVEQMIAYAESQGKKVLAAVNTDFYSMTTGVPLGLVVENGIYKSSPEGHTAVAFKADGSTVFSDNPEINITLVNNSRGDVTTSTDPGTTPNTDPGTTPNTDPGTTPGTDPGTTPGTDPGTTPGTDPGTTPGTDPGATPDTDPGTTPGTATNDNTVTLTHFNKFRNGVGGLYLFSSAFSTVSTRTSTPGWFVKFRIESGVPSVNGTMQLVVSEIINDPAVTAVPIGDGYLVLTAASGCGFDGEAAKFSVGDQVTLTTACTDPNLNDVAWASGGGDILVRNGALTDPAGWDKAIEKKNPRTALGVTADGTVITFVADGREVDNAAGLTTQSLAEEMLARGCVTAVNLDGGGSSVISVRMPGQGACGILNRPSDGSPRKVGAYLLFVTDAVSDGVPHQLGLTNEGFEVLAGSAVELGYLATDSGYMPVAAPEDIEVTSDKGLGTIVDNKYIAGPEHGVDTLTLTSKSTGAVGKATVHIIYDPTKINIMADGIAAPISSLTVFVGDSVQLTTQAYYYNLPVNADLQAKKYTVEGDVGAVDETGLFTAAVGGGIQGKITVTVGGCAKTIPVTVTGFTDVANHWGRTYIRDLSRSGVVAGVTDTTFEPERTIKRGDFVLMLWRAAGKPAPAAPTTFTDIMPEDYYAQAIAWAEGAGIAKGGGSGLFDPQGTLTREQAFTLVYRSMPVLGKLYPDGTADLLAGFTDSASVSEWAVIPSSTLVSHGIVSGAGGLLSPADFMTRAQMAKILDTVLKLPNIPQSGQTVIDPVQPAG